jgi:AcrR family transcriptional regulator
MIRAMTSNPVVADATPPAPGPGRGAGSGEVGDPPAQARSRRSGAAARRRERQREIVEATRALFDQREMRDANIDDIARAVGVNRAIIYRHFASKDELFALTLAEYLAELDQRLAEIDDPSRPAPERLATVAGGYADFCLQYPAFLDCALALLRQPGEYLLSELSEAALQRVGRSMVASLGRIADVLRAGTEAGDFAVEDADVTANMIYLQTLGALHIARSGFIVRDAGQGMPEVAPVDSDQFRGLVVRSCLAAARS